jgi:hypothetical protein
MMDFFATNAMKVVTIDVPSTAENIAAMLLRRIVERLPHGHSIDSVTVRVFETEKTFAEVSATIR